MAKTKIRVNTGSVIKLGSSTSFEPRKEVNYYEGLGVIAYLQAFLAEQKDWEGNYTIDWGISSKSTFGYEAVDVTDETFYDDGVEMPISHLFLSTDGALILVCYDQDENYVYYRL